MTATLDGVAAAAIKVASNAFDTRPSQIKSVRALLQKLPKSTSSRTVQQNLDTVQRLGRPGCLLPLLREILSDRDALDEMAGRSYRHVNHFDKIVLVDSEIPSDYRLTLHLWMPPYSEIELNEELIHDHRFSFWSTILVGSLASQNYVRAPDGKKYRQYRYIPEERDSLNFYKFMGEERLVATGDVCEAAGQAYYLPYNRIHRVVLPRTSIVCTLVLRGPRENNHSNVYNTVYPRESVEMKPIMFSSEQVKQKLQELLNALS